MVLVFILAVLVVHLGQSAARAQLDPPARVFCQVCGTNFGGASALGHHMTMAHPPEDGGCVVSDTPTKQERA